jgi:hypothetical protein
MNKSLPVNNELPLVRQAEQVLRDILASAGAFTTIEKLGTEDRELDLLVEAQSEQGVLRFAVDAKQLITPRRFTVYPVQRALFPTETIPLIFAPVISPRVAELAKAAGFGYFDAAGNCWIHSAAHRLLIDRQGRQNPNPPERFGGDPFARKSSRIVRAMLNEPLRGWQVRELAEQPEVSVSPGLVVKVKRTLVEEGFAIEHNELLYVRDPAGLLQAWAKKYPGPQRPVPLYVRGDVEVAERTISQWCQQHRLQHALAGLSAAWRLAGETRYNVATLYVEERGFDEELLQSLATEQGAKRVDSGANAQLWRTYDPSVFANLKTYSPEIAPCTSPLQTHLDVQRDAGRGAEAAEAIYERHLREPFAASAHQAAEFSA